MKKPDAFLMTAIFGQSDPREFDKSNLNDEPLDPLKTFIAEVEFEQALAKTGGPLRLDPEWNERIADPDCSNPYPSLKASRCEIERDENGERVGRYYDATNVLVDVQYLLPLHK
jgi:hypothetical protein